MFTMQRVWTGGRWKPKVRRVSVGSEGHEGVIGGAGARRDSTASKVEFRSQLLLLQSQHKMGWLRCGPELRVGMELKKG